MPTKQEKHVYRLVFFGGADPAEEWFSVKSQAVARALEWKADAIAAGHKEPTYTIDPVTVEISAKGLCNALNKLIEAHCLNES